MSFSHGWNTDSTLKIWNRIRVCAVFHPWPLDSGLSANSNWLAEGVLMHEMLHVRALLALRQLHDLAERGGTAAGFGVPQRTGSLRRAVADESQAEAKRSFGGSLRFQIDHPGVHLF